MKIMKSLFSTAVCGVVLAYAIGASAEDIRGGVATVVRIQGEASYTLSTGPNAKWIPLVAGKILQAGATIKTEPGALVDVVLGKQVQMPEINGFPSTIGPAPDSAVRGMVSYQPATEQNVIRLSGDTTLAIDKLTVSDTGVDAVSDTELDLQHGKIFFSVKKLSAASQYLIKIPNGIAGVRGTLGSISADGSCWALQHSVWLSITLPNGQTKTIKVEEGHGFNPQTGDITVLSPEILLILQQISAALETVYHVPFTVTTTSYSDHTTIFISPTSGKSGQSTTTPPEEE